jgi:hypothetical protein
MGRELPVLIVVAGASVLALWLYVRLGDRRPRSLKRAIVQVLVALAALSAAPPLMAWVLGEPISRGQALVALLVIFLPAMTYTFLAVLHFFEHLQRRLYLR